MIIKHCYNCYVNIRCRMNIVGLGIVFYEE